MTSVFTAASATPLLRSSTNFQPFETPKTIHSLHVHHEFFATKQTTDTPITKSRMLTNQLQHSLHQRRLIVANNGFTTMNRTMLTNRSARVTFGNVELLLHMFDGLAFPGDRQKFPSAISFSIALSSSASARSFLSRAFSTSSSFRRFASSAFIPPYC